MHRIQVIDSHTEGEPTRVVIDGGPDLTAGRPGASVADQLRVFREQFDHFRSAIVNEPRGSDPLVGALVCPARNPRAACGVIFFNNVGYLNACGHGSIGLAATLLHMGRIGPGNHIVETPVGEVTLRVSAEPRAAGADAKAPAGMQIEIDNVASYRHAKGVPVAVEWQGGVRRVHGDIAWGGNWFFLVEDHGLDISVRNIEELTAFTWAIRQGLERAGITGKDGGLIDHIELFGPPGRADADSRNFVLCPGKAYDRSPCGTGTSAKLACLYADGKLALGAPWRQESVIGSRFVGSLRKEGDALIPTISGRAFITAESTLLLDDHDPFCWGVRA